MKSTSLTIYFESSLRFKVIICLGLTTINLNIVNYQKDFKTIKTQLTIIRCPAINRHRNLRVFAIKMSYKRLSKHITLVELLWFTKQIYSLSL